VDGGEELYDTKNDPFEWNNLATEYKHHATLDRLRSLAPKTFAEPVEPKLDSLPALQWKPLAKGANAPPSKPDGGSFDVAFVNRRKGKVQLLWMDQAGGTKPYAVIAPGGLYRQRTRPGAVWMIADAEGGAGRPLGYFEVGDRSARAVVQE
jgi:hypothetical protein